MARLLRSELRKMEIPGRYRFAEIQQKENRLVCRVFAEGTRYVLKYFGTSGDTCEIRNYQILIFAGIPTIPLLHYTDKSLLLEDLEQGGAYRLGVPEDFHEETAARHLGRWYRTLHERGASVGDLPSLTRESDVLTGENITLLRERLGAFPEWEFLRDTVPQMRAIVESLPETLVHTDFSWSNLAVARDGSAALPFDYHQMGRGYRFSDVRNVCSGLPPEAQKEFLRGYGSISREEAQLDAAVSPVISLIKACLCDSFPDWTEGTRARLKSGEICRCWGILLE